MDVHRAHMTGAVLDAIANCGTVLDFILPNYTCRLQVCDVRVNKPFKGYLRDEFEFYMYLNPDTKVRWEEVAKWVLKANSVVGGEGVLATWATIGIFNNNTE